jgi:hypothetical protein
LIFDRLSLNLVMGRACGVNTQRYLIFFSLLVLARCKARWEIQAMVDLQKANFGLRANSELTNSFIEIKSVWESSVEYNNKTVNDWGFQRL